MHNLNVAHTELYELFDKKSSKFLGMCHLDFEVKGEDSFDRHLKLTINLKFTYHDDLSIQTAFSSFLACYIHRSDTEPRASISSHNPFQIGGIEINPLDISGQRVGGLIFNKIITWLKNFPDDTQINPIDYKPTGNPQISKTFYMNFGVPTNGDSFTISDLKLHDTWTQNIKKTNISTIQKKISELDIELLELQEKCANLKNQIHLLSDVQYTTNLIVAFKSCHIQPNLTVQEYYEPSVVKYSDLSEETIIYYYLKFQTEISKKQNILDSYIQILNEFNEYKHRKNRWRNIRDALKMIISIYKEKCLVILFIFVLFICLYFSTF